MASYRELTDILGALLRHAERGHVPPPDGSLANTGRRLYNEAVRGKLAPSPWTPFAQASALPVTPTEIVALAKKAGVSAADMASDIANMTTAQEIWINSRYQVAIRRFEDGAAVHLSIKRIDQEQVHSWRDLQRIKNELVGYECEGVELYPAESRVVDGANQYHLWCYTNPTERFPIGFNDGRQVSDDNVAGEHQAPREAAE